MADMDRLLRVPLGKAKARRSPVAPPSPDRYDPDDDSDDDAYADDDDDAGLEYGSGEHPDDREGRDDAPDDDSGPTPEQVDCARDAIAALNAGDARKFAEAVLAISGK